MTPVEAGLCWGCDREEPLRAVRIDEELTVAVCQSCEGTLRALVVLPTGW